MNPQEAVEAAREWSPEWLPEECKDPKAYYADGDEDAPFFSEAYLYNLIGKDHARTVLAIIRPLLENVDVSVTDPLERRYFELRGDLQRTNRLLSDMWEEIRKLRREKDERTKASDS